MRICFVGFETLPVLSRAYNQHGIGGEQVQHSLLARAFAREGADVSVVCLDYGQPDRLEVGGVTVFKSYRPRAGVPILRFYTPRLTGIWAAVWKRPLRRPLLKARSASSSSARIARR